MPELLTESVSFGASLSATQMAVRLLVAAACGVCVGFVYRWSHGRDSNDGSPLFATLVLLSILIAMVSMVIGDSVARAFSLVGALSIVRFRTVVDDTRDTAFVIFAVVVGMAAGAGLLLVPLVGIPITGAAAILLSHFRSRQSQPMTAAPESTLTIRLGLGRDPKLVLGGVLERHLETFRLISAATARQGSALEVNYRMRLRATSELTTLVAELNQVEGVQSVEARD